MASSIPPNGANGLVALLGKLPAILALAGVVGGYYVSQDHARSNAEKIDRLERSFADHQVEAARRDAEIRIHVESMRGLDRALADVQRKLDRLCAALRPRCRED